MAIGHPPKPTIANRRRSSWLVRAPVFAVLAVLIATPQLAAVWGYQLIKRHTRNLPSVPNFESWRQSLPQSTRIDTSDGTPAAILPFRHGGVVGHRFYVRYGRIPSTLVKAILAAEDVRFFAHSGVDAYAVVRAAWANYRAGRVVEGASTITQQVVRNLLPQAIGNERSLRRKLREALLARRIERLYSKHRILEVWANQVFLGANAYGVKAAARAYFDRELSELTLAQAALIAGLAQSPGRADPFVNLEAARNRRDEVLRRMQSAEFISQQELDIALSESITLTPPRKRYGFVSPWHTEHVRRALQEASQFDLERGGLVIETTAQSVIDEQAERTTHTHLASLADSHKENTGSRPPQAAVVAWDYHTGYVELLIGGRSWAESQYDRVQQACRQPGSAFKPIVFTAALELDVITPGTPLRDGPIAIYDGELNVHWKPASTGRRFRGVVLAQDALAGSVNAAAVDVLDRVGGDRVISLARRLGLTTRLADVHPMALGASCVNPMQLTFAYAVIARGGDAAKPKFITRVARGWQTLADDASPLDPMLHPRRRLDRVVAHTAQRPTRILDERTAHLTSLMLRDVVTQGTATQAKGLGRPAAGKTGTTNDNTDAWFVGYTSRIVSSVWIGFDDPRRSLRPTQDGSRAALPLWLQLVGLVEDDRPIRPIIGAPPEGLEKVRIDKQTGLLAQDGQKGSRTLYFKQGTAPTTRVDQPQDVPVDLGRDSFEF